MEPIWQSTVGSLIRRSTRRHPTRTALIFEKRSYTYHELDEVTDRQPWDFSP